MRVDSPENTLEFDNMRDRPIKGSTEWQRHQVVLDVPEEGSSIHFGVLLNGKGQVWLTSLRFEEAPDEPVTAIADSDGLEYEPANLDFLED